MGAKGLKGECGNDCLQCKDGQLGPRGKSLKKSVILSKSLYVLQFAKKR